jgi:hypothetical protein
VILPLQIYQILLRLLVQVSHNLEPGDFLTFANAGSFTAGQTDYVASDFDDVLFEVQSMHQQLQLSQLLWPNETGTGATNNGTLDTRPYYKIGPLLQAYGYGWGTGTWFIYLGYTKKYFKRYIRSSILVIR